MDMTRDVRSMWTPTKRVSDRKSSDTQLILVSLDILLDRGICMAPAGTGRLVQPHSVMDKSPSLTGASPVYYIILIRVAGRPGFVCWLQCRV